MRLDADALRRVRRWLVKADEDLLAADILRSDPKAAPSTVGYHVQQAIEKSLKAYLVACRRFPGKIHDLGILVKRAADLDGDFASLAAAVETWTDFAVEERYPSDWPGETPPPDLDGGIALARSVRALADSKIAGELPEPP